MFSATPVSQNGGTSVSRIRFDVVFFVVLCNRVVVVVGLFVVSEI